MKKYLAILLLFSWSLVFADGTETDHIKKIKVYSSTHPTKQDMINVQLNNGYSLYIRANEGQKNLMLSTALTAYTTGKKVTVSYSTGANYIDLIIIDETQQ